MKSKSKSLPGDLAAAIGLPLRGSGINKSIDNGVLFEGHGVVHGGVAILVSDIDIGPSLKQKYDHFFVALLHGFVHESEALKISLIDLEPNIFLENVFEFKYVPSVGNIEDGVDGAHLAVICQGLPLPESREFNSLIEGCFPPLQIAPSNHASHLRLQFRLLLWQLE